MAKTKKPLGPYSAPGSFEKLDGRSRQGAWVRRIYRDLRGQIGGKPTPAQEILIDNLVVLHVKLSLLSASVLSDNTRDWNDRQFIAWSNALRRGLAALGVAKALDQPPPSLRGYLKDRAP